MAKRYTDSDKYKDNWFIELEPNSKLLFYFLIDNVNIAGFWEESIKSINFFLGLSKDDYLKAKNGLLKAILISDCENIIYLKNFLKHQKNMPLNKYNNAHKSILEHLRDGVNNFSNNINFFNSIHCFHILKKNGQILESTEETLQLYLAPNQPLIRGIGKGKVIVDSSFIIDKEKRASAIERILKAYPKVVLYNDALKAIGNAIQREVDKGSSEDNAIKVLEDSTKEYAKDFKDNNEFAVKACKWFDGGGYHSVVSKPKTETKPSQSDFDEAMEKHMAEIDKK